MAGIDDVREKLEEPNFWQFVTLNEEGPATATPVWVDVDEGHVIVNTAVGRRKEKNVRRDPRVTLSSTDLDNPYSWVETWGRVVEFVEGGQDEYPYRQPGERRVILRIEPTKVIVPKQ